jgi:hypothetical protein
MINKNHWLKHVILVICMRDLPSMLCRIQNPLEMDER